MIKMIRWWYEDWKFAREDRARARAAFRSGKPLGDDFIDACMRNFERDRKRGIPLTPDIEARVEILMRQLDGKRVHDA